MKANLLFLTVVFLACACVPKQKEQKAQEGKADSSAMQQGEVASAPKVNVDSLVNVIDLERDRIEKNLKSLTRTTLPTTALRAQIRQKWSKIDYYSEKGQIVRIKSYPYKQISERTEEFYFRDGKLILAFIEDEGMKYTGKSEARSGKTYYFFRDESIKEINQTNEKERTIRYSDSERLLQEATEYLELFPKK